MVLMDMTTLLSLESGSALRESYCTGASAARPRAATTAAERVAMS